jgi:hypothetical protein
MDDGDIIGRVQLSVDKALKCGERDEVVCDEPEL